MPRQNPGEPYYRVDSPEALQILQADPEGTVVIDVRRDDEWVTGHASGAVHINVDDLARPDGRSAGGQENPLYLRRRRPQRPGLRTGRRYGLRLGNALQRGRRHPRLDRRRQPHFLRRQPVAGPPRPRATQNPSFRRQPESANRYPDSGASRGDAAAGFGGKSICLNRKSKAMSRTFPWPRPALTAFSGPVGKCPWSI